MFGPQTRSGGQYTCRTLPCKQQNEIKRLSRGWGGMFAKSLDAGPGGRGSGHGMAGVHQGMDGGHRETWSIVGHKALHTCTSWYAYAAMFGSPWTKAKATELLLYISQNVCVHFGCWDRVLSILEDLYSTIQEKRGRGGWGRHDRMWRLTLRITNARQYHGSL